MIVELLMLIMILSIPVCVLYKYSRTGLLGVLSQKFEMVGNIRGKRKWMPFVVEQDGSPRSVFISNATVGLSEKGICVKYIFPFSIVLKGFEIPISALSYEKTRKRFGLSFYVFKVDKINSGYLMFPIAFLSEEQRKLADT